MFSGAGLGRGAKLFLRIGGIFLISTYTLGIMGTIVLTIIVGETGMLFNCISGIPLLLIGVVLLCVGKSKPVPRPVEKVFEIADRVGDVVGAVGGAALGAMGDTLQQTGQCRHQQGVACHSPFGGTGACEKCLYSPTYRP